MRCLWKAFYTISTPTNTSAKSPGKNRIPSLLAISLAHEPPLLWYHPTLAMTLSAKSKQAIPSSFAQRFLRRASEKSIVLARIPEAHVCTRLSASLVVYISWRKNWKIQTRQRKIYGPEKHQNTFFWQPSWVGGRNSAKNEHGDTLVLWTPARHCEIRSLLLRHRVSARSIFPSRCTVVAYSAKFQKFHSWAILHFHKAMILLYRTAAFHATENHSQRRCTHHVGSFVWLYRHELARWDFRFNLG